MAVNNAALDRLLCERLGIEGTTEHDSDCDTETYDWGNPWRTGSPKCTCTSKVTYPALSTTWDGMGRLMEALRKHGRTFKLLAKPDFNGYRFEVLPSEWPHDEGDYAWDTSAPLALALAAARALGIEVPECGE